MKSYLKREESSCDSFVRKDGVDVRRPSNKIAYFSWFRQFSHVIGLFEVAFGKVVLRPADPDDITAIDSVCEGKPLCRVELLPGMSNDLQPS